MNDSLSQNQQAKDDIAGLLSAVLEKLCLIELLLATHKTDGEREVMQKEADIQANKITYYASLAKRKCELCFGYGQVYADSPGAFRRDEMVPCECTKVKLAHAS